MCYAVFSVEKTFHQFSEPGPVTSDPRSDLHCLSLGMFFQDFRFEIHVEFTMTNKKRKDTLLSVSLRVLCDSAFLILDSNKVSSLEFNYDLHKYDIFKNNPLCISKIFSLGT